MTLRAMYAALELPQKKNHGAIPVAGYSSISLLLFRLQHVFPQRNPANRTMAPKSSINSHQCPDMSFPASNLRGGHHGLPLPVLAVIAGDKHVDGRDDEQGEYEEVYPEGTSSKDPSPLKVKEVTVNGSRYIVCKNERQAILDSQREKLKTAPESLIGNKGYRNFLRIDKETVTIDENKVALDARFYDIWVLTTNTNLSAKAVALKYKELWILLEEQGTRVAVRTECVGVCGKLFKAVGVAVPPIIRIVGQETKRLSKSFAVVPGPELRLVTTRSTTINK
jgi:hypothetical protein